MATMVARRPMISAWSAVSPYGVGRAAYEAGVRSGGQTATMLDTDVWAVPDKQACLVPGFDIRAVLGKRGTRSMDRVSALAVTAVRELLGESEHARDQATGDRAALVLGTTTGSAQSMMDFSRDSFVQDKPYFVDTARFPNAVMNCAAGQCAIWHQLRGPNATVAGGRVAGLYALNYARRLLAAGRARTVLCGAVEEYSSARSWLEHHTRPADETDVVLGEGCGMLLVEPAEPGGGLAEVLAVEFAVTAGVDTRTALASAVRRALDRARVRPADLWAIAPSDAPGQVGAQERDLLAEVCAGLAPVRIGCADALGDTAAASVTFQIISVLHRAVDSPAAAGRIAMVTAVDRAGVVGCALLRLT